MTIIVPQNLLHIIRGQSNEPEVLRKISYETKQRKLDYFGHVMRNSKYAALQAIHGRRKA